MNQPGVPPLRPAPSRLVVVLGDPGDTWGPVALGEHGLTAVLEAATATPAQETAAARSQLEERCHSIRAELAVLDVEAEGLARSAPPVIPTLGGAAGRDTSSELLTLAGSLRGGVDRLVDALAEWDTVIARHHDAEAALAALATRIEAGDDSVRLDLVDAEVEEAEGALIRADGNRRRAFTSAVEGLVRLGDGLLDAAPARLWGRAVVAEVAAEARRRHALDAVHATREARRADLERCEAELAAASEPVAPSVAAVALEAITAVPTTPVVVDDVLARLDDHDVTAVLDELPGRLDGRPLVYLTGDLRVLAWAMRLAPAVGGIAGAVDRIPPHE